MTSALWARWLAYVQLEPFGPLREDFRAGAAMALLANLHRAPKTEAYQPDDFFSSLADPTPEEPNPDRLLAVAQKATVMAGVAGLATDFSNVPDIFLSPEDLARKRAAAAAAPVEA
jgi:hypothetical protein